jgi:hypothetical protein
VSRCRPNSSAIVRNPLQIAGAMGIRPAHWKCRAQ